MSKKTTGREVKAFAPATVANLGLGFDILGLALVGPGDTVTARLVREKGVRMGSITGDGGVLPNDAGANTAGIAAAATLRRTGIKEGIELDLEKGLPIGSGLGSSAASAAAAAWAVNRLLGSPLRRVDLVEPCVEAEEAVSGRHADNVAPALLGGLILVQSLDPPDLVRLPVPEGLSVVVVTPDFVLNTRDSRSVLPESVPLKKVVRSTANIAAMVSACYSGDMALLARCVTDEIVTPARAPLIPGCGEVMDAALNAGALGSNISGAGPSVFALCRSPISAARAADAMKAAFAEAGLESTALISPADCPGARST
ncbi:MAG: homoserine kinase [Deltaproteobacteria bacterium]|nr:homoserine kinase [Deltaproteobacteria bacterium]